MKITILGTGDMAAGLPRRFPAADQRARIDGRDAAKAEAPVIALGALDIRFGLGTAIAPAWLVGP